MTLTTKLDYALKLAAHGFRVFPLSPNSKIPPKGFTNWEENASSDPVKIRKWWSQYPQFNIAISTQNLLVVDVDVKDNNSGLRTMEALNRAGKTFPPTAQQTTATNGVHLIYKAPHAIKNSVAKLGAGIDVRGNGGYVVAGGSTINGKAYVTDFNPIENAPDWLVESCVESKREKPQAHVKIPVDMERAIKRGKNYLAGLPPVTEGARNHSAYQTAAKLKDYGLDKKDTFLLMLDEWKCEPPLEAHELEAVVTSAYNYGIHPQGADSIEAQFDTPISTTESGEDPVAILNKEYAFVTVGSGHRIIKETTNPDDQFELQHYNEDTFHKILLARNIELDGKVSKLSKHWMQSHKRRSYEGLVFSPGLKVADRFYNLWRGFSVDPLEVNEQPTADMIKAVNMFEEHLLVNICSGDIEQFAWVYGWFAHIIQKPWEKPGVALVLRGKKGVGKNVLLDCVGELFKPHYMVTAKKRYITGQFNSHMENKLLFVLDEATWGGNKEDEGVLKALITENEIEIERKGVDSYEVKSRLRVAILGNENWLVPATEDERRYAVFNVGETRRRDLAFFGELKKLMANGGDRYLLTKLKAFDLDSISVRTAPMTDGLAEQKLESLKPIEAFWHQCLVQGYIKDNGFAEEENTWSDTILFRELYAVAIKYVQSTRGFVNYIDLNKFSVAADGLIPNVKAHISFGHVKLPSLDECRKFWDKRMGFKTTW